MKKQPITSQSPYLKFFGRRVGKKLTTRQKNLWQNLLPQHRLSLTDIGKKDFWQTYRHWWLEIGFGGGENLYHWGRTKPDVGFIGAEPFQHAAVKFLAKIDDGGEPCPNVKIYPDDIHQILPAMPDNMFDNIVILYPDPWPKKRHRLRRMISPLTLPIFHRILKPDGKIVFATDQPILLQSTMLCFQQNKNFRWCNNDPAQWGNRPDMLLPSRYEVKSQESAATQKKFGPVPTYLIYQAIK